MSNKISCPFPTFDVELPAAVFFAANMTFFKKYKANYPTRVLTKALLLQSIMGNEEVKTAIECRDQWDSRQWASKWFKSLPYHPRLAVLEAFYTWWRCHGKHSSTSKPTDKSPDWLAEVLDAINPYVINLWIEEDLWPNDDNGNPNNWEWLSPEDWRAYYLEVYEAALPESTDKQAEKSTTGTTDNLHGGGHGDLRA